MIIHKQKFESNKVSVPCPGSNIEGLHVQAVHSKGFGGHMLTLFVLLESTQHGRRCGILSKVRPALTANKIEIELTNMFTVPWKSMQIYVNMRKSTGIYEALDKFLDVNENR